MSDDQQDQPGQHVTIADLFASLGPEEQQAAVAAFMAGALDTLKAYIAAFESLAAGVVDGEKPTAHDPKTDGKRSVRKRTRRSHQTTSGQARQQASGAEP